MLPCLALLGKPLGPLHVSLLCHCRGIGLALGGCLDLLGCRGLLTFGVGGNALRRDGSMGLLPRLVLLGSPLGPLHVRHLCPCRGIGLALGGSLDLLGCNGLLTFGVGGNALRRDGTMGLLARLALLGKPLGPLRVRRLRLCCGIGLALGGGLDLLGCGGLLMLGVGGSPLSPRRLDKSRPGGDFCLPLGGDIGFTSGSVRYSLGVGLLVSLDICRLALRGDRLLCLALFRGAALQEYPPLGFGLGASRISLGPCEIRRSPGIGRLLQIPCLALLGEDRRLGGGCALSGVSLWLE